MGVFRIFAIRLVVFVGVLFGSLSPHQTILALPSCSQFLHHLRPSTWVGKMARSPSKVAELAKAPLFSEGGEARLKVLHLIEVVNSSKPESAKLRSISGKTAARLKHVVKSTEIALFDPAAAPAIYAKPASQVTVGDAFLKALFISEEPVRQFLVDDEAFVFYRGIFYAGKGAAKLSRALMYAVVGVGLWATVSGVGGPFWDLVRATVNRYAFVAADAVLPAGGDATEGAENLSEVDSIIFEEHPELSENLVQVYRLTKKYYSDVDLMSLNSSTYFENAILDARQILLLEERREQPNYAVIARIHEMISHWPARFRGFLESREGERARALIQETIQEFHPDQVQQRKTAIGN